MRWPGSMGECMPSLVVNSRYIPLLVRSKARRSCRLTAVSVACASTAVPTPSTYTYQGVEESAAPRVAGPTTSEDIEEERASRAAKEAYVELRDRWHRTALHWAVVNMEEPAVEALIIGGAAVNGVPMPVGKHMKQTSLPLEAPLHSAARLPPQRAVPLLRLLLQAQADVARTDQFGQTALHCAAAASGSSEGGGDPAEAEAASTAVVALLLRAGADPCHTDSNGKSAADLASHTLAARAIRDAEGPRG